MGRETLGEFEHLVLLAIVRLGGPAYSVPILEELERCTGGRVAPAAVYIALRRLEKRGLVRSVKEAPSPVVGGRGRRFFEILPEGLAKLRESRRRLEQLWEGLDPEFEEVR
jgi:PadR family transcriptional regulator